MIATLVIFMREGIEASMIVAILLAYLNRIGQRRYFRDVFIGVGAALALAAAGGVAAYLTIRQYDGSNVQTIFETGTYLLAAVVLTYMTFWMRGHARGLSGELRARADAALTRGARTGLALLAFQAVGREGLETVVFTLAIVFSTSTQGALLGAVIGLAISLAIAFFIYRLGHKLNLSRFFTRHRRAADVLRRRPARGRRREHAAARLAALPHQPALAHRRAWSARAARSATSRTPSSGTPTARPCSRCWSTSATWPRSCSSSSARASPPRPPPPPAAPPRPTRLAPSLTERREPRLGTVPRQVKRPRCAASRAHPYDGAASAGPAAWRRPGTSVSVMRRWPVRIRPR